jgi:hypothetical protein
MADGMVAAAAIEKQGGDTPAVSWTPLLVVACHIVVTWGWWNRYADGIPFDAREPAFWIAVMAGSCVWPFHAFRPVWKAGLLGKLAGLVATFMLALQVSW